MPKSWRQAALLAALVVTAAPIGAEAAGCAKLTLPDDLDGLTCRVAKSGMVAGSGGALRFQIQEYIDDGASLGAGVAVFGVGAYEKTPPVAEAAAEDARFDAPVQFRNKFGAFLDLGAETHGTGQFPLGRLFMARGDAWTPIDVEYWQQDLSKRLPKDMQVWRGPFPDYPDFAAAAVVRQKAKGGSIEDEEGYAAVRLTLAGDKLVIDKAAWQIGIDGPCAVMPDYPRCNDKGAH